MTAHIISFLTTYNHSLFIGFVPAYENIWILGDSFMAQTYGRHFQQNESREFFMKQNFNVFMYDRFNLESGSNILSRLRNSLIDAMNDRIILPKLIIIVPDYDIVRELKHERYGISMALGKILDHIVNEMKRLIEARKDQLGPKSKKFGYPHVLWIEPPLHKNFTKNDYRRKFNENLESILKLHTGVSYLKLKDRWDYKRDQLSVGNKITGEGLNCYWEAIDGAIKYWVTKLGVTSKIGKQIPSHAYNKANRFQNPKSTNDGSAKTYNREHNRDKYTWRSKDYIAPRRFKLPSSPRHY